MKYKYVARFVDGWLEGVAGPFDLDQSAEHYAEGFEAATGYTSKTFSAFVLGGYGNEAERNEMVMKSHVRPPAFEAAMRRLMALESAAEDNDRAREARIKEQQR